MLVANYKKAEDQVSNNDDSKLVDQFTRNLVFSEYSSLPVPKVVVHSPTNKETKTAALNTTPVRDSPFLFQNFTNLTSSSLNARILFATDEWFASADNLLKDSHPLFIPDLYCEQGKVMDGWESRRRREAGHDWCVIKLADGGGDIWGIEVDTAHFTGNQTPRISIEVMNCKTVNESDDFMYTWMPGAVRRLACGTGIQGIGQPFSAVVAANEACLQFEWNEILPMTELKPGYEETRMHYFTLSEEVKAKAKNATHVRLNYYPDGGVARLRLWGYPPTSITSDTSSSFTHIVEYPSSHQNNHASESIKPLTLPSAEPYKHPELSLCTNGGRGIACSNKHYGVPANLIQPTYGIDMGDGWETARHPERPSILVKDPITHLVDSPLMDWAILKLGMGGASNCPEDGGISRLIIDTKHFKGNYPESVRVEGCFADRFVSDEMVCGTVPDDHDTDDNDDGKNHNNIMNGKVEWFPILPRTRLYADQEHVFERGSEQLVNSNRAVTHVRISIYPDGGISRVRVYGKPALEAIQQ